MNKQVVTVIAIVILLIGARVGYSIYEFAEEEANREGFRSEMTSYLALRDSPPIEGGAYIKGKLVTIDLKEKAVDYWTYSKLPSEIKALTPNEVGTIVFIDWGWKKVGDYQLKDTGETVGEAKQSLATVSIIDNETKEKVLTKVFIGQEPIAGRQVKENESADFASARPTFDIIDFLKNLPRK